MFSKTVSSINEPLVNNEDIIQGTNKAGTACTVKACKAPSSGNCVLM